MMMRGGGGGGVGGRPGQPGGPRGGPPGSQQIEKAKDRKGALIKLLKLLAPYKMLVTLIFAMAVTSTVFNVITPRITARFINEIAAGLMSDYGIDASAAALIAAVFAGLAGMSFIFNFMQQRLMAVVANETMFDLRNKLNGKLSRMPLSYFDKTARGEIMSRMTNDIENMSGTLQQNLTQIVTASIAVTGILIMMFSINIIMTLISLVTVPLCMFVLIIIMGRSRKFFARQWEVTGKLNAHIEEIYTGHNIIKAFSKEEAAVKNFRATNKELFETSKTAQFLSGLIMPLMGFINNIGYVLICVTGGIFAINGRIDGIGYIQAMIQYSRNLTMQINQTGNIFNTIQSALASAERVFALLEEPEEEPGALPQKNSATQETHADSAVTFTDVEFRYDEDKPLIKNMNLDVKAGQTVAIVGPTGAGKTTLVNLLMRFYDINSGAIKVKGADVRDMPRSELRNTFGMVLQDTWLFSGTVYDNIAYGRESSSREEIYAAAKAARADYFISTLADGYDTVLEEDGANLSQGQRQLLAIARAVNAGHDILILDEATSSVDTRTEILIQKAMASLMKGKTSFIIAHRLSTIRSADIILVMNRGDIIEQGLHEELLEKGGFYSELYKSQFQC